MKATELLELLREFYRDKLAMRQRHVAAARLVTDYDFNNTYQYVIAREDVHLSWLRDAITDLGGTPEDVAEPQIPTSGTRRRGARRRCSPRTATPRRRSSTRWRAASRALPNARHRTMLRVILGETLEHKRFFDQALAGRTDLLGRRADGAGTGGGVLPTRWVEQ